MRFLLSLILALSLTLSGWASPRVEVKKGNKAAKTGNSAEALTRYRRALTEKGDSSVVFYDIGNALYDKGDFENASKAFMGSLNPKDSPQEQAATLYNLGNSFYQAEQYDKSISAYVESLKRNPGDKSAKYNLELAKLRLQEQKQQQQQQQKQDPNQQKQDQKQDPQQQQNQDQEKKDQKQDQQQQQQPPEQKPDENQQQPEAQPGQQLSKEDAERLLNALLQDEQNALKDAKKMKVMTRAKRNRDW
jgi:Ca-activated chloride channel homolog